MVEVQLGLKEQSGARVTDQVSPTRLHVSLLIVSFVVCVCFLFLRPDGGSNDFQGHLAYLRHIQSNPLAPFGYIGRESWHPPTYYYLASISEQVGSWVGLPALKGARMLSILFYLIYIHFALRTFRLLFEGRVLWCASVLFILWPSNSEMSTRINSDLPIIPVYAAVQFYVVRSVVSGNLEDCLRALCVSCIGLLFKTSALVPFGLACLVTVLMIVVARIKGDRTWRVIVARWIPALLVAGVVCLSVNCSRLIVYTWQGIEVPAHHLGGKLPKPLSATDLLALRPWRMFETPFVELSPTRCSAAEYAFKSAIFTEQPWMGKGKFLGRIWVALVLFQLLVTMLCLARRVPVFGRRAMMWIRRTDDAAQTVTAEQRVEGPVGSESERAELVRWSALLVVAFFPVVALLVFAWKQNWTVCCSYRFVLASLVAWIGLLLMPVFPITHERREGSLLPSIGWLGAFTLMTWGTMCLVLKIFRPLLGWN